MKWHGAIGRMVQFLIFAALAALATVSVSLAGEPNWMHRSASAPGVTASLTVYK